MCNTEHVQTNYDFKPIVNALLYIPNDHILQVFWKMFEHVLGIRY